MTGRTEEAAVSVGEHDGEEAHGRAWDRLYVERGPEGQVWSGRPNGVLVDEAADLSPGRALDVGCGEGGDAIWLAQRGWVVTAIDPSQVAIDRAAAAAGSAGVDVTWVQGGLPGTPVDGRHDLVSVHYGMLQGGWVDEGLGALLDATTPGGVLLVVHHDLASEQAAAHDHHELGEPIDPDAVAALLDDGWRLDIHERRRRHDPPTEEGGHGLDVVLRATRRPTTA